MATNGDRRPGRQASGFARYKDLDGTRPFSGLDPGQRGRGGVELREQHPSIESERRAMAGTIETTGRGVRFEQTAQMGAGAGNSEQASLLLSHEADDRRGRETLRRGLNVAD